MYIKIATDNSYISIYGGTECIFIDSKDIKKILKNIKKIKLGLTSGGIDTLDPEIISKMSNKGVAVELADYYLKSYSVMYRSMMGKLEKDETIKEFKEEQEELKNLDDLGYVEYEDTENIIRKIERTKEIEDGRIACIGEDRGCMETTNGSQYCCKVYCPYE